MKPSVCVGNGECIGIKERHERERERKRGGY